MRGGRNKFGPMYKRDRARKLQVMRNRTAVVPGGLGGVNLYPGSSSSGNSGNPTVSSNSNPNTMYTTPLHTIKQEIQIPQVTSMTSSPDSSPSPVQLPHGLTMSASTNNSSGLSTQGQVIAQQTDPSTGGIQWQISTSPNSGNRVSYLSFLFEKLLWTSKASEHWTLYSDEIYWIDRAVITLLGQNPTFLPEKIPGFQYLRNVKILLTKMWILLIMLFWTCENWEFFMYEFCQKWGFQNVNFVKIEIF